VAILPTWRYDRRFGSVIRLTAAGVVLRIHALIEAVILHPVSLQGSSSASAPSAPHIEQLRIFVR
jgi:hypothetical protein